MKSGGGKKRIVRRKKVRSNKERVYNVIDDRGSDLSLIVADYSLQEEEQAEQQAQS